MPAATLAAALAHVSGTRAPLARATPLACADRGDGATEPTQRRRLRCWNVCLARRSRAGWSEDATIAASEAQAEAFWRMRDSLSEAERARGPAVQHDISVPVDDDARAS